MSKLIAKLRFILWREWFLRFRLRSIVRESHRILERGYEAYLREPIDEDQEYMSFPDWCEALYGGEE